MTFSAKNTAPDTAMLTVELSREDLAGYLREAQASLGNNVKVDGFRKGKVPPDQLHKHIGENALREAALEIAVERSLARIISDNEYDVISMADLAVKENTVEKLTYTVNLRLYPAVTLPNLITVKVARNPITVDALEIEETLKSLQVSRGTIRDKNSPATNGDRVEVDFQVSENGAVIEGGVSKNHPLILGGKQFVPGFEDQLIGMKKGDQKNFSLTVPKDFANATIAGKKLDFSVTMQSVQAIQLPELTDAFAQSVGRFQKLDDLKVNIRQGLEEEKKDKERQRLRLEIMNKIIVNTKVLVSAEMTDAQLAAMIENFDTDLHRHDMELSLYLAKIGKTQDDLKKEWRPEAERQVKMALAVRAIARTSHIDASPEEVENAMQELLTAALARGQNTALLNTEQLRQDITEKLVNEKTLQYLEDRCSS